MTVAALVTFGCESIIIYKYLQVIYKFNKQALQKNIDNYSIQ